MAWVSLPLVRLGYEVIVGNQRMSQMITESMLINNTVRQNVLALPLSSMGNS